MLQGASPLQLGRGKPHAAGARWDAGSRVDAPPPVRKDSQSPHTPDWVSQPKPKAEFLRARPGPLPREEVVIVQTQPGN